MRQHDESLSYALMTPSGLVSVIAAIRAGVTDALQWRVIALLLQDVTARSLLVKSCLLNLGLLVGVAVVVQAVLWPALAYLQWWQGLSATPAWVGMASEALLFGLFILPVYALALLYNSDIFAAIATRVYGAPSASSARTPPSGVEAALDSVRGTLLAALLVLLAALVRTVPGIGVPLHLAYTCWLNSFYCFDYKWTLLDPASAVDTRIALFERHWAYMLGFGLPCTLALSLLPSTWALGGFAVAYPFCLSMAMVSAPHATAADSPFVPARLAIFHESRWLLARILERLPGVHSKTA